MANNSEIRAGKARLRAHALAARAMMAHAAGDLAARRLVRRGLALIATLPGEVVAGYVPVRHEIDVLPLLEALAEAGRKIVLPVVEALDAPLIFRRWAPGGLLREGRFGVPVPPPEAVEARPDILVVPLAAFDRAGNRLGYGGGYYDRTLAALRASGAATAIGAAFGGQELDGIGREKTDQPLDWIVTDRETIRTNATAGRDSS